jgi:hypothetical protein
MARLARPGVGGTEGGRQGAGSLSMHTCRSRILGAARCLIESAEETTGAAPLQLRDDEQRRDETRCISRTICAEEGHDCGRKGNPITGSLP